MKDDICNYGLVEIPDCLEAAIEKEGKERRAKMIELVNLLDKALHRVEPENRVLTLEELKNHAGFLWNENRYDSCEGEPAYAENDFLYVGNGNVDLKLNISKTYGRHWRCWLRKPTKEEMEGTPWEGDGHE